MTEKRFDFEDEYITFNGGVFTTAKNKNDAELISKTLNQLYDENEQLKQSIDIMGGRLQGLWANYCSNRWSIWSEAVEDIANELGFKIHHAYDEPISNSESKKERVEGVKKITEILGENELIKQENKELKEENEQSKMMIATLRNMVLDQEDLEKEYNELKKFKDKVFEVIDNHILEETDLRKECIENGSHYTANISRNIIDTLKLIKKELF